jgi:transcriptional regulator CtsR
MLHQEGYCPRCGGGGSISAILSIHNKNHEAIISEILQGFKKKIMKDENTGNTKEICRRHVR